MGSVGFDGCLASESFHPRHHAPWWPHFKIHHSSSANHLTTTKLSYLQLEANETTRTFDRTTPISRTNARGQAEIEFLSLDLPQTSQVVLNLAGLWGGEREPRNWLGKVLPNKEALRKKGGLHMSESSLGTKKQRREGGGDLFLSSNSESRLSFPPCIFSLFY